MIISRIFVEWPDFTEPTDKTQADFDNKCRNFHKILKITVLIELRKCDGYFNNKWFANFAMNPH